MISDRKLDWVHTDWLVLHDITLEKQIVERLYSSRLGQLALLAAIRIRTRDGDGPHP